MKYLEKWPIFIESLSFNNVNLILNDNSNVEYNFEDYMNNKFLVQFKKLFKGNWIMSYYAWDNVIDNWSVSKLVESNPWRIVSTVLGKCLNDFIKRRHSSINNIKFEGLAKENEKDFISTRTKMYLRFLKDNPIEDFEVINFGNNLITLKKINK